MDRNQSCFREVINKSYSILSSL